MSGNLIEYFNKQPRLGVISTSNKDGTVDSAVIGSPQMTDEKSLLGGALLPTFKRIQMPCT